MLRVIGLRIFDLLILKDWGVIVAKCGEHGDGGFICT